MLADILFLAFASILLVAALGVITARNAMYCVLFMILAFFNAAGLFVLMGAEFLGLLLVMVYVGAIAVMFLFVVMTIDVDFDRLREGYAHYLPVGLLVAVILLIELIAAAKGGMFSQVASTPVETSAMNTGAQNIEALGQALFTSYVLPFQGVALVLLTAMVGAIVLTHRKRPHVKRQDVASQIRRRKDESMVLTRPNSGEGANVNYFKPKSVEKE